MKRIGMAGGLGQESFKKRYLNKILDHVRNDQTAESQAKLSFDGNQDNEYAALVYPNNILAHCIEQ